MDAEKSFIRKFLADEHRADDDWRGITRALEDLPDGARAQAAEIAGVPSNLALQQRIIDELENAGADLFGNLERSPLLHFLSDYPVPAYTYRVSDVLARGERPSPLKLQDLLQRGKYRVTVNLCAELLHGDTPVIAKAGLASELRTYHIPVVDLSAPAPAQVLNLLNLLTGPGAQPAYVHCEAGKCRTGVMIACYRMAVMGWDVPDALQEARNFGCSIPMQQAFIQEFGALLKAQHQARTGQDPGQGRALGQYPLKPLGSVTATPEELAATVASVALVEKGQVE